MEIFFCLKGREESRILKQPAPNVLLKGFGDSSVEIEMRVWIRDPRNGVSNIKSAILLRVWDKFHEHGIEIPYRSETFISSRLQVSKLAL
jgi:small-conductance mechanosensitive channel